MEKCRCENGVVIKPDGVHELDPCIYQDIGMYKNVTVIVSKCKNCGNIDIRWMRQEDTEDVSCALEG